MTSESQPPNDADDRKPDETQAQPNRATSDASVPSSSGSSFDSVQSTATNDLLLKIQSAPKLDQERFRAEDEIGKGGVGAVTRVYDKVLNRSLAMKTLLDRAAPRDEEERRMESQRLGRFLEEAQVTSQLDHPGVVPVHELGLDQDGKVFFTMRLVKGRTVGEVFDDVANQRDDWTLTRALEVVLKMCDTMAYAHEKRVLHRDLKPANVMVGRFGEVYVMDWGLAKILGQDDRHDLRIDKDAASQASVLQSVRDIDAQADATASVVTLDGTALGTPSYMPPEQAKGEELDLRADVYAIGAMLYQLLTGQVPYVAPGAPKQAYRILEDVWRGPPEPIEKLRAGVPPALVAITEKAMARERDDRYASVADLADDLRAFLENRVVSAHRTGALVEMKKWVQRNKAFAAAAAAAVLSLVAGIVVTWQLNQETQAALSTAVAAREEADTAREEAVQAQGRAVRLAYSAQFGAASIAQKSGNVAETQSLLARCQEEQRNWEWDHLAMGLDPTDLSIASGRNDWMAMDLSPDSTRIALVSRDNTVVIKDASTGETVQEIPGPEQDSSQRSVEWDPSGARLLSCSKDQSVVVWDVVASATKAFRLGKARTNAVAWSPDGRRFAAGCDDGIVRVCDATSGQVLMSLAGHGVERDEWGVLEDYDRSGSVIAVAWSPDGTKIASGSWDRTGRIWNASTGRCLQTLSGHGATLNDKDSMGRTSRLNAGAVKAIAWSPNSEQVLTGSADRTVRVWEALTGYCLHTLEGHRGEVLAVEWCPDGVKIVSAGDTIRVWDALVGDTLNTFKTGARNVAWSADGAKIFARGGDRLVSFDAVAMPSAQSLTFEDSKGVFDAELSPDGKLLAVMLREGVVICDATDGRRLMTLAGDVEGRVENLCVSWSPDSDYFVVGRADGSVAVWASATGEQMQALKFHTKPVHLIAWSPDGARAASLAQDGLLKIWDVATGEETQSLRVSQDVSPRVVRHDDGSITTYNTPGVKHGLSWSPDGAKVATSNFFTGVSIWNAATGKMLTRMEPMATGPVAWSPDGKHLASSSSGTNSIQDKDQLRIFDVETGRVSPPLPGHKGEILDVVWSPDSKRIASAGQDRAVRIWDAASGLPLKTLEGHEGYVQSVQWCANGRRIVSCGGDVRIWESSKDEARPFWRAQGERAMIPRWLDALWEQHHHLEGVLAAIRADRLRSAEARQIAMDAALARVTPKVVSERRRSGKPNWRIANPAQFAHEAWLMVDPGRKNTGAPVNVARALRISRAAVRMAALDGNIRNVHAWALFANGHIDWAEAESVKALEVAKPNQRSWVEGNLRRMRAAVNRERVADWVDDLFFEHVLLDPVLVAIDADTERPVALHDAAREVAKARPAPSAIKLNNEAWALVDPDRADKATDVGRGLKLARAAVQVDAKYLPVRDTYAWALFANGLYEEALTASAEALEMASTREKSAYSSYLNRMRGMVKAAGGR